MTFFCPNGRFRNLNKIGWWGFSGTQPWVLIIVAGDESTQLQNTNSQLEPRVSEKNFFQCLVKFLWLSENCLKLGLAKTWATGLSAKQPATAMVYTTPFYELFVNLLLLTTFLSNFHTDVDECDPNPCKNGGGCTDGVNTFTCTCEDGYSGETCDVNVDDCNPNPCQNGGACTDGINSFTCNCEDGFTGITCQTGEWAIVNSN